MIVFDVRFFWCGINILIELFMEWLNNEIFWIWVRIFCMEY